MAKRGVDFLKVINEYIKKGNGFDAVMKNVNKIIRKSWSQYKFESSI